MSEIANWNTALATITSCITAIQQNLSDRNNIYRNGTVATGRDIAEIGAHCKGHNASSIGICYIGGLASDNRTPKDTRTTEQKVSLLSLTRFLKGKFPNAAVIGHRDTSPDTNSNGIIEPSEWLKACPSFDAKKGTCYSLTKIRRHYRRYCNSLLIFAKEKVTFNINYIFYDTK